MRAEHRRRSVPSQPEPNPAEIVVTRTKVPILRAGTGLLIFPLAAVMSVLLYMSGRDASHSPVIASVMAAGGAIFGLLYLATVASRISNENGAVRILRSFDEVIIPNASIERSSVRLLIPSRWFVVSIWRKERRLPIIVHFVVMETTSTGDLGPTETALKRMLHDACA